MRAAALDRVTGRRIRAVCESLDALQLAPPHSPWPEVLREAQMLLDAEHVWCFLPRLRASGWEIPVWYGAENDPAIHPRFAHALATGPREWAWFKPSCPDKSQRNRAIESVSRAERAKPGFFETSHLYATFFRPLGLHRHHQLRVLVCDGPHLLAWFGALQPETITARQRAIVNALVPSLSRRLVTEERLAVARAAGSMLEVALDQLGAAALVLGRRGEILHANAAARTLLDARRPELARALADAQAGRPHAPSCELVPIDNATWLALVREADEPVRIEHCVRAAATRWQLTARRREVLARIVTGETNAAIAALLGVTVRAIELHVTALLERAGVASRAALVAKVLAS